MKSKKINLDAIFYDALATVGGCCLTALGLVIFTIPNDIAPGGVSGLATALAHIIPFGVGVWSLILNIPLAAGAWRLMGIKPLAKTFIATVLLSVLIDLFAAFIPGYPKNELLSAVLGGVCTGAGTGVLFLRGISTGGTDLLSMLLTRAFPNIRIGNLLMLIDAAVVVIAVFIFQNIDVALYSLVTIFVNSKLIDAIMEGVNYAKVVYIITDRGDEVTELITNHTERGVTVTEARGGYTRAEKSILTTVTRRNVLAQTLRLIKQCDPDAFIFVVDAAEVHGEGFKRYTAGID
ncbi:membrane protein [Clostridia bacterium]|nr:membrane protein [Clostridia bacterium]